MEVKWKQATRSTHFSFRGSIKSLGVDSGFQRRTSMKMDAGDTEMASGYKVHPKLTKDSIKACSTSIIT